MKNQNLVIISFNSPADAARAGIDMSKGDPSIRYEQKLATLFVTWHSNIIAAMMEVDERGLTYSMTWGNEL